jgi:hypothetical protein
VIGHGRGARSYSQCPCGIQCRLHTRTQLQQKAGAASPSRTPTAMQPKQVVTNAVKTTILSDTPASRRCTRMLSRTTEKKKKSTPTSGANRSVPGARPALAQAGRSIVQYTVCTSACFFKNCALHSWCLRMR